MENEKNNLALIICAGLLILFFTICGLSPLDSMWGFNHLQYLNLYYALALLTVGFLIVIPQSSSFIEKGLSRISNKWFSLPRAIQVMLALVVSATLFYFLRVEVHSLGDGYQRIYQIEKGYFYYYSEPFDFFAHAMAFKFANIFTHISGEAVYQFISILSGLIFVLTVYLLKFPAKFQNHGFVKTIIITLGGSLFFFGYVESYSLLYMFGLLFLVFALRFVLESKGLILTSILFLFSCASHLTGFMLYPLFIFLLLIAYKSSSTINLKKIGASVIGLVPVIGYFVQKNFLSSYPELIRSTSNELLPIYSADLYSIFSSEHIIDIVNQTFLIAPVLILLIIIIWQFRQKIQRTALIVASLTILPALVALLVIDPKLGYARDWDLFALPMALVGISVLSVIAISEIRLSKYMTTLLGGLAIVFLSSWIAVNSSASSQLVRAENLLSLSDKGAGYSAELLAEYYKNDSGDMDKAIEILDQITGRARNGRVCMKIGRAYMESGNIQKALEALNEAYLKDSTLEMLNYLIGINWMRVNQPRRAMPFLLRSHQMEPNRYNVHHSIGTTFFQLDSLNRALTAYKNAVIVSPQFAPAYYDLANVYRMTGQFDSAMVYIQKGLKLNSSFPGAYDLLDNIKTGLQNSVSGANR